ncbi:hypothetical protein KUV85_00410 [Nocardioides panacisoli]|uniref:hypothetical protein n=1 Tax=Nocardioides panacisoli TaxID=627624 RepID=UPI001C632B5B|nr:hypothetical protein [Nocardioides panacisoli]QYJ04177.1 hypothetical protein KUV85_00410 [Nocardioides panacisoli]
MLGRIAIGQVARSTGGDYADYVVVRLDTDGRASKASMLGRRSVMASWRDLLWAALDGEGAEPVAIDDPKVVKIIAKVRAGVSVPMSLDRRLPAVRADNTANSSCTSCTDGTVGRSRLSGACLTWVSTATRPAWRTRLSEPMSRVVAAVVQPRS